MPQNTVLTGAPPHVPSRFPHASRAISYDFGGAGEPNENDIDPDWDHVPDRDPYEEAPRGSVQNDRPPWQLHS